MSCASAAAARTAAASTPPAPVPRAPNLRRERGSTGGLPPLVHLPSLKKAHTTDLGSAPARARIGAAAWEARGRPGGGGNSSAAREARPHRTQGRAEHPALFPALMPRAAAAGELPGSAAGKLAPFAGTLPPLPAAARSCRASVALAARPVLAPQSAAGRCPLHPMPTAASCALSRPQLPQTRRAEVSPPAWSPGCHLSARAAARPGNSSGTVRSASQSRRPVAARP